MGEADSQAGVGGGLAGAPSMRRRAVRGSAWVVASFVYGQGVRLVGNIVLAYLLRDDIGVLGIMVLVNSLNRGLQMASSVGLNLSVVQHEKGEELWFLHTAWTLQVIRGALLFLVCCIVAVPYAAFYGEPVLVALVPFTGLVLVAVAFQSPGLWLAERRVEVWRPIAVDVITQTISLGTMIVWAAISPSVWALAVGIVLSGVVRACASYAIAPASRPRFRLDRGACGSMLRFGGWLLIGTLLTYFATDAPTLAMGRVFTKDDLAVFAVALMLATFSSQCVSKIASMVIFPLFSEVKNRGGDLVGAAGRVLSPLRVMGGAATAAMYASGPMAVTLLWPSEMANAAWMVRLLAMTAMLVVLGDSLKMLLLSLGEARPTVWGHVSKLVALAVLLPAGAWWTTRTMGWGLPGFVAGAALSEAARYLTYSLLSRRYGVRSLVGDGRWMAVMALAAVTGAFAADAAFGAAASSGVGTRVAAFAGGAAGGAAVLALYAVPMLRASRELRGMRG